MSDTPAPPPNPPLPRGGSAESRPTRVDPRRYIPPTRVIPDVAGKNERFLRKVLSFITTNAEIRREHQRFGEVAVRFTYADGVILSARLMEETILKNDD